MGPTGNIDKWSFGYNLLRLFTKPKYNRYYSKIQIANVGRIPMGQPVIIAPNHQNALMDAMALVMVKGFQMVFLMRADVFKGNAVKKFLHFIKTIPIYRIRDGRSALQKNEEIFELAQNILHNQTAPICMFPEGNHGNYRRLRPLVKGVFRIAFKAQEEFKTASGVKIIPVGIDYGHYQKFRQSLLVNFGEAIEVNEYWNDYEQNPSLAINKLSDRLALEMKKYMVHIETEVYYDLFMGLRPVYGHTMCKNMGLCYKDLYHRLLADKKMLAALDICLERDPDKIEGLQKTYDHYVQLRDKLNLRDWVPQKQAYNLFFNFIGLAASLVALPLVLLGIFNNWPHYFLAPGITKGIKDTQFHSTAKWGMGVVISLLYYLVLMVIALIFLPYWWLKLVYIITLPSSGVFAYSYRNFIVKTWAKIRYTLGMYKKETETRKMKQSHDRLADLLLKIIQLYEPAN